MITPEQAKRLTALRDEYAVLFHASLLEQRKQLEECDLKWDALLDELMANQYTDNLFHNDGYGAS